MEQRMEDGPWSGLAGFAGDVLWRVGQIGQGMLDVATVLLLALLVYHQGAAMGGSGLPSRGVVAHGPVQGSADCEVSLIPAASCIVAQPLKAVDT